MHEAFESSVYFEENRFVPFSSICSVMKASPTLGTAILRVIFIELCRRVRIKFPKS